MPAIYLDSAFTGRCLISREIAFALFLRPRRKKREKRSSLTIAHKLYARERGRVSRVKKSWELIFSPVSLAPTRRRYRVTDDRNGQRAGLIRGWENNWLGCFFFLFFGDIPRDTFDFCIFEALALAKAGYARTPTRNWPLRDSCRDNPTSPAQSRTG